MSMTNTTSPIHGDKSTKSALALPGQVPDFAAMLKERSRQRKDREDAAVASLRVQVQRLEAALQAETKRRVAVTQQLKQTAQGEWERIEENLQKQYRDLAEQSDSRWVSLEDRLSLLEDKWKQDVLTSEKSIAETAKTIESRLEDIELQAQQDKESRQALNDRLTNQIREISEMFDRKWNDEAEAREKAVGELREKWEATHHDTSERNVTDRLEQEVEQLRVALVQERMEREQHDDGLLQNLQAYSDHLEESLAGIL
uniref:Uncharacterized protein n=1 Tax=Amphora coffeiformis TaxID=265554 RepID=A0A7S3P3X7_9STRA